MTNAKHLRAHLRAPQRQPALAPAAAGYSIATVKSAGATECEILVAGAVRRAAVASHLSCLVAGQRVAALDGGAQAGWLVLAAWPAQAGEQPGAQPQPLRFDQASGTLHIQAAHLNISALAAIDMSCGEARIRLSLDGRAHIEALEILSSAIGPNRIEGASIDLN